RQARERAVGTVLCGHRGELRARESHIATWTCKVARVRPSAARKRLLEGGGSRGRPAGHGNVSRVGVTPAADGDGSDGSHGSDGTAAIKELGRPRNYDPATERDMLVRATRRLLWRNRYTDVTLAAILDESGLHTRAFYRHFHTKDDVLLAIYLEDAH